jgi:hypothetical protein
MARRVTLCVYSREKTENKRLKVALHINLLCLFELTYDSALRALLLNHSYFTASA